MTTGKSKKRKTLRYALIALAVVLVAALVGARIYLPYWLTDYVNRQIAALDGYGGRVNDIDVHLWRGAYQIHNINIYKERGGLKEPFFAARTIDLSVEWRALFNGAVVAEMDLYDADLNFSKGQTGEGAGWARFVDALSPLDINRFEIHGGKVAYIDRGAQPPVNLYIHGIEAQVKNLRNVTEKNRALPSPITVSGESIGGGRLGITGAMNILKNVPDFDLNAKLVGAPLPAFNNYARDMAGVAFRSGDIAVYSELAAANGRVTGYVKPIVTHIDIAQSGTDPITAIWRTFVAAFMEIFKNHPRDQFAMRVPIDGRLSEPNSDTWSAFLSIFSNAFGGAFSRDTDGNVTFNDALMEKE